MESYSLRTRMAVCALLLCLLTGTKANDSEPEIQVELDTRAIRDFYPKDPNLTSEKQLLGALQEVLEKLQTKRIPPWEKKFGQVPMVYIDIIYFNFAHKCVYRVLATWTLPNCMDICVSWMFCLCFFYHLYVIVKYRIILFSINSIS
uniref:Cocaine- and amphetamine-regulated transcript 2 n=1 Tax=Cyprinus carpio carpio TaxID=630221 RepID=A0A8C1BB50_CYPCA